MENNSILSNLGEIKIIKLIEKLILEKTGKKLIRDDAFFFKIENMIKWKEETKTLLIFNSDMLVSNTDVPQQMSFYQTGRKAILMNVSDLIVKGVRPKGIFISLGLPKNMKIINFKELMNGIIDYCKKWNVDYIGGDINETSELIINPVVFGFQNPSKIIYRNGLKVEDYLVANGKFGLTGVGFDIVLNNSKNIRDYSSYKRSIMSVLELKDLGKEAFFLAENNLASASIDSSDGLAKSLKDLMLSNPNYGFEIEFNEDLIDNEAINYSKECDKSLENLVFNAGEEFIHIFTINPKNYKKARNAILTQGGQIFKIGKVISKDKIYILKDEEKIELKSRGFEHFSKNS